MSHTNTDFLIIGGGVIGVNMALEAKRRYPDRDVLLIDKEPDCGLHASGRNSGVIHAGFYYTADSLKAKFTREGNLMLREYCEERNLKIKNCGKLVVAKDETELPALQELLNRGKVNNVPLEEISAQEAAEIEPRVKTFQKALYSPTTSSVDPKEIMRSLLNDAVELGVKIQTHTEYLGKRHDHIVTSRNTISAAYIINAAGLYADKIAMDFGFSQNYRILPFKGLYLYSNEPSGSLRTNIYPVPNLNNPFLGVHFTVTVEDKVKIGPTAIPAFWREHYSGLTNFKFKEFYEILTRETQLFINNKFQFRQLAIEELTKYYKPKLVRLASQLISGIEPHQFKHWGTPGIRAQLLDISNYKLEMDFKFEGDKRSFHILNAVSPAFTCCMPFTRYLFDQIDSMCA